MQNKTRRLSSLLVVIGLIGLIALGWFNRFNIYDWWRLRGYTPSSRIVQLADDITLTDYGRRLFYVNHPQLNDEADFNQNCTISEHSIVLGCYIAGRGIYVFDVTDERLKGVHQVTAGHEMLHAAYERLSKSDRQRIDALTAQTLSNLTDERIISTIDSYRQRDANVVPNELHSILATEVESLPSELEAYYQKYFKDRHKIVAYSKQYEAAFQERKNKIAEYDEQLAVLKQQIEDKQASLNEQETHLLNEKQRLDALLAAERYEEYNAGVPAFNASVRSYNSGVTQIQKMIDRYNQLVAERNAIVLEESELIDAIDSRPSTLPTR